MQFDVVARFDPVCRVSYRRRADTDLTIEKELLQARAAELAGIGGEKPVDARAGIAAASAQPDDCSAGIRFLLGLAQ
jgi:hypothetical protein